MVTLKVFNVSGDVVYEEAGISRALAVELAREWIEWAEDKDEGLDYFPEIFEGD